MEAHDIDTAERIPASRKLGRERAIELATDADRMIVARGKNLREFAPPDPGDDDTVAAMLGSTGNLRAPTLVVGKTVLVGFNEERYSDVLL